MKLPGQEEILRTNAFLQLEAVKYSEKARHERGPDSNGLMSFFWCVHKLTEINLGQ